MTLTTEKIRKKRLAKKRKREKKLHGRQQDIGSGRRLAVQWKRNEEIRKRNEEKEKKKQPEKTIKPVDEKAQLKAKMVMPQLRVAPIEKPNLLARFWLGITIQIDRLRGFKN